MLKELCHTTAHLSSWRAWPSSMDHREEHMKRYVEGLKALADETRLRIIRLLLANQTATCVCELVDALEERQYNISRHLQVLEVAGLLEAEKDGRWVYYRVAEPQDTFVSA